MDLQTQSEWRLSLACLTEEEKGLLDRILTNDALWLPLPGPQLAGYVSEAEELFFGGSAGGGKSDLLLGLAITNHANSVIYRREFTQFSGARGLIRRSWEILQGHAKYNGLQHTWRFPNGRALEFGACQHEKDKFKYQGRPHDFIGFDEAAEFTESQFRFLVGWLRSVTPGQRCRVVAAGNPPSRAEGEWVIRYWAPWLDDQHPYPAEPGELRWFARVDDEDVEREDGRPFEWKGETVQPKSRTFIPARLSDNPYLAETGYKAILQGLPEPLRSQLLYGDFTVGVKDDPWQVIPTEWVRLAQRRWQETPKPDLPMTALGVDVARGGDDQTVIAPRYGNWFAPLQKHPGRATPDGPAVAALVMAAYDGEACISVDVIGIGSSVYDTLQAQDVHVVGVNFAEGTDATDRTGRLKMRNVRAAAYWGMREALDPALGDDLALPPDNELLADLCAPRWRVTASGVQIESKEDIVDRLGRSPNCGDAAVLALYGGRELADFGWA